MVCRRSDRMVYERGSAGLVKPRRLVLIFLCGGLFANAQVAPKSDSNASSQTSAAATSLERERGKTFLAQGKVREAIVALKTATKRDKTDSQAWHFLGLALIQDGKFKDATKSFETALKLQPGFAPSHTALAYAFLLQNKSSSAIREAQATLNLDANTTQAHYIVGVGQLRLGKKDEALKEADVVIKNNPQFALAYLLKSQALVSFLGDRSVLEAKGPFEPTRDRFREAADALEKYLQLDPNSKDKQTWTEQLESLRFHVASHKEDGPARVYSGKEVVTKARVISKAEPQYTDEARFNGVTGTVVLRCIFTADGTVKHFLVLQGLPFGLTQQALKAARGIKFLPATVDGRPVSMFIQLEYNFNLH